MLYLVATPIGNLGDFTPRAREILENADIIACEDTRTSHQLFSLLGLKIKKMVAYHDFNETQAVPHLIQQLQKGLNIALVSDAGMPLISDPGYKLVHACREKGIDVYSVPGANAVLAALQLSGLPSNNFYFGGFLPPKTAARKKILSDIAHLPCTIILYETNKRLLDSLNSIQEVFGNREIAVVREITKKFEETKTGRVSDLLKLYNEKGVPKGEIVLVIAGNSNPQTISSNLPIKQLRSFLSAKDTAQVLSLVQNISKKEAYVKVLENES